MKAEAALLVEPTGNVICLYTEIIPLQSLGKIETRRATTVEFDESIQKWQVKEPGGGVVYHSNPSRQKCLEWEQRTFGRSRNLNKLKRRKP